MEKSKIQSLPSIECLLVETPLYSSFEVSDRESMYLLDLFAYDGKLDVFCPECGKPSTFEGYENIPIWDMGKNSDGWAVKDVLNMRRIDTLPVEYFLRKIWSVKLRCTRANYHMMSVHFYINDSKKIEKIGQYPSIAQLTLPELRKYQSILSTEKYKELNRGIGLTAHGVGIGAFVYLRRVFEDLVEEAHQKEKAEVHWDEEIYQKSRIKEKIQLLQHSLPSFLVENNGMYSILSKGIHELSEKDCLDFFPAMKLSVELILDEKLERYQKQKKIEEAKASIIKIQSQLAKG